MTGGDRAEQVLEAVRRLEADLAWTTLEMEDPHGVRAQDVARVLRRTLVWRTATWNAVHPTLERLATEGELHRCVPKGCRVPRFRTMGA